jgi:hypothetical protein
MKTEQTIQERLASPEVLRKIKDWLRRNKHESRLALARYVCEELVLKDPRGKSRLAGVQKALRVLEDQLRVHIYAAHFGAEDQAQNRPIEEKRS